MPGIVAYTQAELLDIFGRILPIGYWQPIVDKEGDGFELFQAIAQVLSLTSAQVERYWRGGFLTLAPEGSFATVEVVFSRPDAGLGAVTVLAGTVVTTSNGGRDFITNANVVFGIGDLGPHTVLATALYPDEEFNVPGERTSAFGELFPGSIDIIKALLEEPPYGDPTIVVKQVPPPTLSNLGQTEGFLGCRGSW